MDAPPLPHTAEFEQEIMVQCQAEWQMVEKSTLELDKTSDRLAATVATVLRGANHQKDLNLRLQALAAKKAAGG